MRKSFPVGWQGVGNRRPTTIESGRPIADADIIAFSISFENDYPHLLTILDQAGIPLRSGERSARHPLVIAGGVACFLNPEPIAALYRLFSPGRSRGHPAPVFSDLRTPHPQKSSIEKSGTRCPRCLCPCLLPARYHDDGTLAAFEPLEGCTAKN